MIGEEFTFLFSVAYGSDSEKVKEVVFKAAKKVSFTQEIQNLKPR